MCFKAIKLLLSCGEGEASWNSFPGEEDRTVALVDCSPGRPRALWTVLCHSPWPRKPPAQPCSGAAPLILKSHLWCEEREDGERGWLRPGTGACRACSSIHGERCGQEPGLSLVAVCLCPVGLEPGIPLGLDYPGVTGFQLSALLHEVSGGGRGSGRVAQALPCNESILWGAC